MSKKRKGNDDYVRFGFTRIGKLRICKSLSSCCVKQYSQRKFENI